MPGKDEIEDYKMLLQELQIRLGQIVGSYEVQIAAMKVESTKGFEERDRKIAELRTQLVPSPPEEAP